MLTHATTPIAIRSHTKLDDSFERRIRAQLARRIGPGLVERATVRFEDTNGPKGGIDTICRISLVVATRPTIIVAKIATSVHLAFAEAVHAIGTALSRTKHKRHARRPASSSPTSS
jgi:ribosome-associated translation inhibitor RaiA